MKKYILVITLVLSLVLVGCGPQANVQEEAIINVTSVEVMTPIMGSITNETDIVGRLVAENNAVANVQLGIPEEIIEVKYRVGDFVEAGETIVVLASESTDDQVENARLSYETALRNYDAAAESVATAQKNLERTQALFDQGLASTQQLESAKLQASDGQLKTLLNQVNQAKFAYDNAKESIDNTFITAPITGIISALNFEENNLATSQNTLIVTDISSLEINLQLAEKTFVLINDETDVKVVLDATGEIVESSIISLNPVADQRTGLYGVTVEFKNETMTYQPGMFATVRFNFSGEERVLIPIDAVLSDDQGEYVFVVENNQPIRKNVVIGEDDGEIIEVISGLVESDLLVISGQNYITEDTDINVVNGGQ